MNHSLNSENTKICIVVFMGNITQANLSIFTVEGMIHSSHVYDLKKGVREKSFFFIS